MESSGHRGVACNDRCAGADRLAASCSVRSRGLERRRSVGSGRRSSRSQPQRRPSGLHGLVDHGPELGRERVQVDLVAQAGAEGGDGLGGVVAAAVADSRPVIVTDARRWRPWWRPEQRRAGRAMDRSLPARRRGSRGGRALVMAAEAARQGADGKGVGPSGGHSATRHGPRRACTRRSCRQGVSTDTVLLVWLAT